MNTQVFRGRTMVDARRAAIDTLGPDAVVVTTRHVRRTGVAGWLGGAEIEIAAVAGEPIADRPTPPSPEVPFAKAAYADATTKAPSDIAALRAELKGDIRTLKNLIARSDESPHVAAEIAQLRELIEGLSESSQPRTPKGDKLAARLRALGIEGPAAVALARTLRKAGGESALRAELARTLTTSPWPVDGERTMIALVGPSGVGKTTTAAKLAARARMAGRTVTLVACDTYRVGGTAQLAQYARLMGAECVAAKTSDELRAIIDNSTSDVVIVDTSGKPPTADGVELGVAPSRRSSRPTVRSRHVLLCLPASVRANDAARIVRRFGPLSPTALVITKVDETDTPAGIVHASWASRLPISIVCNGQRVPEDIAAATTDMLVECIAPRTNEGDVAA